MLGIPLSMPQGFAIVAGKLTKTLTQTPEPKLVGTPKVGSTISVSVGAWDSGVTTQITWLVNGIPIPNATGASYKVTPSDLGKKISITVTGSKEGFATATKLSEILTVTAGTMASKTPTLSGIAKVGTTLTAKTTAWISGAKITYQWLLDGKIIKGATRSTYKILSSQKGKRISVTITQSALGYVTASKTSIAIKVG